MKKSLKEILYTIFIGIIIALTQDFIKGFITNVFYNSKLIIIGLYLIISIISLILFFISNSTFNKRRSIVKPQIFVQHSNYIRLTCLVVFIISTVFSIQNILAYNSSQTIPDLEIRFINNGSDEIHIYNRGIFHLYYPLSSDNIYQGKIELKTSDNKNQNEFIIHPNNELIVYGQIIYPEGYLYPFQRGDLDMDLLFYQTNGKTLYQQGISFDRNTFTHFHVPFRIQKDYEN